MAGVIESSNTATATTSTSITFTKPTGLQVDDLLLVMFCAYDSTFTGTLTSPSGFTTEQIEVPHDDTDLVSSYIKATSTEVAASDFTFTFSTTVDNMAGRIYRISGIRTDVTPLDVSANGFINETVATSVSTSGAVTPTQDNVMYFMHAGVEDPTSANDITNPRFNTNDPTWTAEYGAYVGDIRYEIFYANQGTTAEITTGTVDFSTSNDAAIAFYTYKEQFSVTGYPEQLDLTTEILEPVGKAGARGTIPQLELSTELLEPTGTVSQPTRWTNEDKADTTWSNESEL